MRNYRIITKQNNLAAWGGGRSQLASPIRDSIKLILPMKLKLNDNIGVTLQDDLERKTSSFTLKIEDSNTLSIEDGAEYEQR